MLLIFKRQVKSPLQLSTKHHLDNVLRFIWLFGCAHVAAACLPVLNTLQIAHNKLATAADLEHLVDCHNLSVLDVSNNKIDDPNVIDVFSRMTTLVIILLLFSLRKLYVCHHMNAYLHYDSVQQYGLSKIFHSSPGLSEFINSIFGLQRVLNLMGNPVIKRIRNYRKTTIVALVGAYFTVDIDTVQQYHCCMLH